jgi:hypothetical protein
VVHVLAQRSAEGDPLVGPPAGDVAIGLLQLGDLLGETSVIGMTTGLVAQRADRGASEVRPVRDSGTGIGIEKQPPQERRARFHRGAEHRSEQGIAGQHSGAAPQQQHRDVLERTHQPQHSGVCPRGRFRGRPAATEGRGCEVAQMGPLDIVEAQRSGERLEDLVGDGVLASLLQAAVVVRAEPGEHCNLLFAKTGDPPGAGERVDPGLRGGQPVAP